MALEMSGADEPESEREWSCSSRERETVARRERVKCFTLSGLGGYFMVNQILHLDQHGKTCKIFLKKYFTSK